jgi:dGTPase
MKELSAPLISLALPRAIAVTDAGSGNDPGASTPTGEINLCRRTWPESPHPYRSPFVRDIGRILHAKAFRRLAGKTQVFTRRNAESDHSRSRLTHTLEVAQVARTIASTLGLNAPLTEALALVHDIGHPPFGHAGEKALDEALRAHASQSMSKPGSGSAFGFDHNLHALRIVTVFEERYAAFRGLNLTLGVREGIIKHSRDYSPEQHPELDQYFLDRQPPLEAQIIDLADEIAYLTADFEDGLEAGILDRETVRDQFPLFADLYDDARRQFPASAPHLLSNEALKQMLNILVTDLMQEITREVHLQGIQTLDDLRHAPRRIAHLSPQMEAHRRQAKQYLNENLYLSPALDSEHTHADEVVKTLFAAWTGNPELLPPDHRARIPSEGIARTVADYIAGMTDAYIEQAWQRHIQTKPL